MGWFPPTDKIQPKCLKLAYTGAKWTFVWKWVKPFQTYPDFKSLAGVAVELFRGRLQLPAFDVVVIVVVVLDDDAEENDLRPKSEEL